MGVTISTHNGSAVAREHNIRNPKVVSKEAHIKPNIYFDTNGGMSYDLWLLPHINGQAKH